MFDIFWTFFCRWAKWQQLGRWWLDNQTICWWTKQKRVTDLAICGSSSIKKKEHGKFEKRQGVKEKIKKFWKVMTSEELVVSVALGVLTLIKPYWLIDSRSNLLDFCLGEFRPRISHDTEKNIQESDMTFLISSGIYSEQSICLHI